MKYVLMSVLLLIGNLSWAQSSELQALYDKFEELESAKNYAEAFPIVEDMLVLEEAAFGTDSVEYSNSLVRLGLLLFKTRKLTKAEQLFKQAIEIQTTVLPSETLDSAKALHHLASVYGWQGRYSKAEDLLKRALNLKEKFLGLEHQEVANSLSNLSYIYELQGRYAESESILQRVLSIREIIGPEDKEVVGTLSALGGLYRVQGRYSEAESILQRAIEVGERTLGPEHEIVIQSVFFLANIYALRARYTEAEVFYKRVLANIEKQLGWDHPHIAVILNNLAALYWRMGRYVDTVPLYVRGLEILEKNHGLGHPDIARMLESLSRTYMTLGRLADAEPVLKRAITIGEKFLGPEHPDFVRMLDSLAHLNVTQGDYAEAELMLQRVLETQKTTLGAEHPEYAATLLGLAQVAQYQGHFVKAETFYLRAIEIGEKAFGPEHPEVANMVANLAIQYRRQRRYSEAENLYLRSIAINEQMLGPGHPTVANTLLILALAYQDQGRDLEMLKLIRRASSIRRDLFTAGGVHYSEDLLIQSLKWRSSFRWHIDSVLKQAWTGNRLMLETEAFEILQLARFSSTASAIGRMAARFATTDRAVAVLVREQQDAIANYQALNDVLLKKLGALPAQRNESNEKHIKAQLKSFESRIERLNQSIRERFPEYAELTSREPLRLKGTQELLGRDEVLLTMVPSKGDDRTHAFVVGSDKSTVYTVELSTSEIEQMVSQLRSGIDPATGRVKAFDVGLAHELYLRLLSPAEPMLAGVDHLFVVPDGPLESLPFHLLVTEDPGEVSLPGLKGSGQRGFTVATDTAQVTTDTDVGYQDIAWLAKQYAITTLPSVASLRALRVFAKRAEATEPFIGFGDPVLGGQAGETKGLQVASFYRGAVADVDEVRQLSSLPETETELRAMAKYLGADESSIYLRERATETQVKSVTLNQSKVVAFSTHGLVSGELKGLAEPALVLTPPETGTEYDDGLLTASEVAQLKLDADWVILSACNTAAGDKPGATGLSGLAKAFFYAGARALLVSHWPVESNAATALTTKMFQTLKQNPLIGRAEALRQSMMTLASNPKTAHPFFWAPFVVVGEGALID